MKAFSQEKLDIGDIKSSVSICTLWTQADKIKVPKDKFSFKGNLYSGMGINYLLRTLLSNPHIRYVVLCGSDRTGSGEDLMKLFRKGIDEKGKIIGSKTHLDPTLAKETELVDRVRKNVEIIDMRGRESEIAGEIEKLEEKPPYAEPVFVEECREKVSDLDVKGVSGFRLEGNDIADAWLKAIDLIMKFGEAKKSEHGIDQKEVLNVIALIRGDDDGIAGFLPFDKKDMDNYCETFFGPDASGERDLSYTYGKRLFEYMMHGSGDGSGNGRKTFDQIGNALRQLKRAPHTRRAAAFTWSMEKDADSENPPCLTQITWNMKYGKLYQTAVFRSHDIFGGWPLNAFALRELQKRMAKELGTDPGTLTIISNSAHIYENNYAEAKKALQENFTGKSMILEEDLLGYFLISLDGKEIVVQHCLPDGRKTEFIFRGNDAIVLFRKILHEGLVSRTDHAAYLGSELARAEEALKGGNEYVQR